MIPIIYAAGTTNFDNIGLGTLPDCISAKAVRERNGENTLTIEYPSDGENFKLIKVQRIILADVGDDLQPQPYDIVHVTAPIDGHVTIECEHVSYRLNWYPITGFDPGAGARVKRADELMEILRTSCVLYPGFLFSSDIELSNGAAYDYYRDPVPFKTALFGMTGSVLDIFGGEYVFDRFRVKLLKNAGSDNGVRVRYGKNISKLTQDVDLSSAAASVLAFWAKTDHETGATTTVYSTPQVISSPKASNFATDRIKIVDCTAEFEEQPTDTQVTIWAKNYITENAVGSPSVSVDVSFVPLSQTLDYAATADLEKVGLCDSVTIEVPSMGIDVKAKVTKVTYNVLLERYDSIEIGTAYQRLADTIFSLGQGIFKNGKLKLGR